MLYLDFLFLGDDKMLQMGMMWYDKDKTTSFSSKVIAGVDYFRKKYGYKGEIVDCQVKEIPIDYVPLPNICLSRSNLILPHTFFIGVAGKMFDHNTKEGQNGEKEQT
jgi:hypothetical protein